MDGERSRENSALEPSVVRVLLTSLQTEEKQRQLVFVSKHSGLLNDIIRMKLIIRQLFHLKTSKRLGSNIIIFCILEAVCTCDCWFLLLVI